MRLLGQFKRALSEPAPSTPRRRASFPFISGDTYRLVCSTVIESREDLDEFLRNATSTSESTFCAADFASELLTELPEERAARTRLLVHNGDLIPVSLLAAHAPRFKRVHSVNWLGDLRIVDPLPIGIENAWRNVNGRLDLFDDCLPHRRAALIEAYRPDDALVAFNDATAPEVRMAARSAFSTSDIAALVAPRRLAPVEYHRLLRRTKFVVSPRGNGPDCHRTWEALYAGAVPIVLRRDWGFHHLGLPVLIVDSWQEAVAMMKEDPQGLYEEIIRSKRSPFYALDFLRGLMSA